MWSLSIPRSFHVEYNVAVIVTLCTACPFSDLPEVPGLNYIQGQLVPRLNYRLWLKKN